MHCFGLLMCSDSEPDVVTLENSNVEVTVRGFVALMTIELIYRNKTNATVEIAYICPVDVKAAVYIFEAKLEGRTIVAHCMEKKKAKEIYRKAVKGGHTAILGLEDELSGDLLHLSLGNLPNGETAELKLKIVMELPVKVDGGVTFTLPTVFNPRYCPSDQAAGPLIPQPVLECKVFPNKAPYSLNVKAEVCGSFKIAKIISSSDPINVSINDEETSASITQDGGSNFDHDWSFQIYYQTIHKPHCLQMSGDRSNKGLMKDDIMMLNIFPEVPLEGFSPHNEIIFIVDRSGSMEGSKITKAKTALLFFLKSLPPGCRFNILSFGDTFCTLFESSSERYTEETLKKALKLQRSMDADMGGTEMFSAFQHVYSKDLVPGYARQMIVVTDGAIWDQDHIFDLIDRHVDDTRVFSVGIGDGASTALVQGIAEAGRGRYEMVLNEDQLQAKVMGLVASMLQEHVTDLKIECEVTPKQIPSLVPKISPVVFGGQHLILYARIKPNSQVTSVKTSWKVGEKEVSCEIGEKDCKVVHDSNFSFHRLAAKAQLKQWEKNDDEIVCEEIVDLSVSSCVVCKSTAFVGVDQDNKKGDQKIYGKSNIGSVDEIEDENEGGSLTCYMVSHDEKVDESVDEDVEEDRSLDLRCCMMEYDETEDENKGGSLACYMVPPDEEVDEAVDEEEEDESWLFRSYKVAHETDEVDVNDLLIEVISSQKFNGSWNMNDCLELMSGNHSIVNEIQKKISLTDASLGTVLMLVFLESKFDSREQEWKLVALKARKFLEEQKVNVSEAIEICSQELKDLF